MERGLEVLKFFPAELSGGVKMLRALGSVYNISFIPTGGVNISNLAEYLEYDRVLAVGGTWMVKSDLISSGRFEKIVLLTREAVTASGTVVE